MVAFNKGYEPPISEFKITTNEMDLLYKALTFTLVTQIGFAETDDRDNMVEAMEPYLELREKIKVQLQNAGVKISENENLH